MNICGHVIKKESIIGIGPLMVKRNSDQLSRIMYAEKQLHFQLHLQNRTITIESDWFRLAGDTEENNGIEKIEKKRYDAFVIEYNEAKKIVHQLIEEN